LNVTPSLGNTLSINASNGARATIPRSVPLAELDALRMAATVGASSGSNGCIETKSVDTPPAVVERCMITNPGEIDAAIGSCNNEGLSRPVGHIDVGESDLPSRKTGDDFWRHLRRGNLRYLIAKPLAATPTLTGKNGLQVL
jgi:hypothetical protein